MNLRLVFIIAFLYCGMVHAGDPAPVKYLGIEHGLSNNAVTCIYQDHNGFMWFGTYDGLNRYNGYGFKIFRNIIGDSTSLNDNHIYTIEGDADNNIWIGGVKGINVYNPIKSNFSFPVFHRWNKTQPEPINIAVPVIRSLNGTGMLVGSQREGLLFFENSVRIGIQIPLRLLKGQEGNYSVTAIEIDSARQQAWIFIQQIGLCRYSIKEKALQLVSSAIKQAYCLKLDWKGTLWLGNDNGLYRFNTLTASYSENLMSPKNKITDIAEDRQGIIWIASDGGGVWCLHNSNSQPSPYLSSAGTAVINSNAIYDIYVDKEERKWIGTLRGGVNIIEPQTSSFKQITYTIPGQNNIINNFILSFCEDEKDNVWIGTDGAGLRYWERGKNQLTQYVHNPADQNSVSSNFITCITKDIDNDIWIATWFGGINRLKRSGRTFKHYSCFNPKTGQEENNVWIVYQDAQQQLWASASNDGSLYLFDRSTDKFDLFDETIINLQCIAEDREGNLWGGNYTSLINIDRINKKNRRYNIGYPVRCIHEDKKLNFWIGTEGGGLLLFDRELGTFTRFSTTDGLPNNTILRMLEDDKGNLWMSTYNGLCKFDPLKKICRNFSESDGLQSNQFSFNASLVLNTGEFLFGGIKGFNLFFPDSIYDHKETPRIFLTGLKINNTAIEEDNSYVTSREMERITQVTLPFDRAIVSLDFTALEFTGTDKIKYAYYLEGWDKNWNYVNNIRTANYSRLQEGKYIFKIKVTNTDGVWSEETQLLRIIVLPPWYRTWWAYVLYAFTLLSAIYLYIRYNKRQERLRYEIKLAHLENEKEKELTEKKISFFTHISHEFRTPLTLIINPLKELLFAKKHDNSPEKKDISMIYRNARRLLSLVDQLLLFRKVESIDQQMQIERFDIVEVCNEVFLSFGQHAQSKNIDFRFDRNDHEIFIYADKEKIEIILFNLVANAFKYTGTGGTIQLVIGENPGNIEIIVKDNGCGIPADVGSKLFESFYQGNNKEKASQTGFGVGLYVSQKLATAHQGKLSYTSEQSNGTQFRLALLKGHAHFSSYLVNEDHRASHTILHELVDEPLTESFSSDQEVPKAKKADVIDRLTTDRPVLAIVDDNAEIRSYIRRIFADCFTIYEADDGESGLELVRKQTPDIVISDIMMQNMGGIELCQKIKDNPSIAHTPVILLTASSSDEIKLKGIEGGAEDYITKPFSRELIVARVLNILKGRNRLQQYFFNAVTLKPNFNIPGEHKEFIEKCIEIIERHLDDSSFTIPVFCREIGMSHPSLYKKVKSVSGLTVNVFVRYLRLRKAAELLINTDKTIVEVTYITGFNDMKYFREQFFKLFEMNPSDFVKRYRKVLSHRPAEN